MKLLRRALAALALAGLAAAAIRLRGSGGTPPQRGGWRRLDVPPERP
jgi:alpha-beta hydrolase superfamily lysophospholipase